MKKSICNKCIFYSSVDEPKMACFCNHYNCPIIEDSDDDCKWFKNRPTNKDILNKFRKAYPFIKIIDYRPLCDELFIKDRVGITVWTEDGGIIIYYPEEESND